MTLVILVGGLTDGPDGVDLVDHLPQFWPLISGVVLGHEDVVGEGETEFVCFAVGVGVVPGAIADV